MMTEGGGLNQPEKVRHLCEEALPTWEWTIQTLGVEWVEERVAQEGGHSVPRCAIVKNGSGSGIVLKEAAKLEALGSNRAPALIWSASFKMPTAE